MSKNFWRNFLYYQWCLPVLFFFESSPYWIPGWLWVILVVFYIRTIRVLVDKICDSATWWEMNKFIVILFNISVFFVPGALMSLTSSCNLSKDFILGNNVIDVDYVIVFMQKDKEKHVSYLFITYGEKGFNWIAVKFYKDSCDIKIQVINRKNVDEYKRVHGMYK